MKRNNIFRKLFQLTSNKPEFSLNADSFNPPHNRPADSGDETGECLTTSLAHNRKTLESIFGLPTNKDVVIRDFTITSLNKKALIIYIDGLSDRNAQNFAVLQPLMLLSQGHLETDEPIDIAYERLVPGQQVEKTKKLEDVINGILEGSSVLLIDDSADAMIIETKGWEHRGIDRPTNEPVVRGPQEGFNETFRANTASVRRYIKDPKLITEIMRVGTRSRTLLALMYIKDIANPKLVKEVKRRIKSVSETTDYIAETGELEEFIEDHPRSLMPQMLSTERPDRVAAHLREGYVAVIMANSPYALVLPTNFSIFLHAAEDYYLRWPFGNFLRFIRTISIFIALLLPSFYIAVVNYHQEMIPTDLMLAMTAAREAVPFPALVEILFMEFSFELIREAGVRVPSIIGPTIGIVGALILGQAAVSASIVSPILIIIIAITALASFVVPNYNATFTIRILRFLFIILAGFLGFFGVSFGVFLMTLHIANLNSFGVPFLTPIAPYHPQNKDRVVRPRAYDQPKRPVFLRPLDWIRQRDISRPWDQPDSSSSDEGDDDNEE
ncbi:MAG TPA: spore germination protein [Bacillota bacterium]|nr:spore germination protein [Bacillota bacterium]